jgi:poly(hydroxyalkanoate) depolymerase family esterase
MSENPVGRRVLPLLLIALASAAGCLGNTLPGEDGASSSSGNASSSGNGASSGTSGTSGASGGTSGHGTSGGTSGGTSSGASGSGSSGTGGDGGASAPAPCTLNTTAYGSMKMWECIPTGMDGKTAQAAGLVVAMHGYTQGVEDPASPGKAWGFKPTSQWANLAEKHKFYVIFPDHGTSAFQWYAYFGTSGIGRTDLEPTQIAQMVKDMQAKHNIDPAKIFANGLSAGAYMTTVMLATYPDLFSAGSMFEGGAYGCSTSCAALGKKGQGWTWPGNHAASLVTGAYGTVWSSAAAKKPRLMVFQGDADGAVTPENLADVTQQWLGALGMTGTAGATKTVKGTQYTEYTKGTDVMLATVLMPGIGHGTPVDPGPAEDQGGWDPNPSKTASSDTSTDQDWTNTAGIYGPYYSAKFFGLIP